MVERTASPRSPLQTQKPTLDATLLIDGWGRRLAAPSLPPPASGADQSATDRSATLERRQPPADHLFPPQVIASHVAGHSGTATGRWKLFRRAVLCHLLCRSSHLLSGPA